jgi:hypothetical protein
MPDPDTICGYSLSDVRKSLRDTIDRRDRRASHRWTAELIATPGAIGSLWASYWLAWAVSQGAGSASPTIPILLKQTWATMSAAAHDLDGDWTAFRNEPEVRACAAEMTTRLLDQPRQTPVIWPSKEITLYDVGVMRSANPPIATDGPIVLSVWRRDEDAMDLRVMAGYWITALESGDIRRALTAVAWTMQQTDMKCADRGPSVLTPKARSSPLWFWLELGRAWYSKWAGVHRGWPTMHAAITEAFRIHYKRWTQMERMRLLLAWNLQIRASLVPQTADLWTTLPLNQTFTEIDLPYKEIAAELADPNAAIVKSPPKKEMTQKSRSEAKMAEADAAILASLGFTEDD